jgi:glycosyltransferase involved in cell wall biosynthesis
MMGVASEPGCGAPTISIAMTTFNGGRFLAAQLDSIARQVLLPFELIVCDDGSTDDTLPILEHFAHSAPFQVTVRENATRLGYRANFLQAAGLCQGDLIAFCDQDDVWDKGKLAVVAASFASDDDILLVYHNAMLVDSNGAAMRPFYGDAPSPALAGPLTLPPWHLAYGYALTFRRILLQAAPFWAALADPYHAGQATGHDAFFFMLAASLGSVAYLPAQLVQYRQHAAQTIGTAGRDAPGWRERWQYRLEDRRSTYRHLCDVARRNAGLFHGLRACGAMAELDPRIVEAARAWALLASLYDLRSRAVSGGVTQRAAAWAQLCRLGAYGNGYWNFGGKAGIKDALLGVALAPVVARYGRAASQGDGGCKRGRLALQ